MLILTRRKDERIKIGERGEIVVVEIRPDRVRLGFKFPADVAIWRTEIIKKHGPKVHRTELED